MKECSFLHALGRPRFSYQPLFLEVIDSIAAYPFDLVPEWPLSCMGSLGVVHFGRDFPGLSAFQRRVGNF